MALMECGECGAPVSDKAKACAKCGAPVVVKPSAQDVRNGLQVVAVILGLAVVGGGYAAFDIWQTGRRVDAKLAKEAKAREVAAASNCVRTPSEIFPIGERYESSELGKIMDANFKRVDYSPNLSFRVNCAGTVYVVQTRKVDDNKPTSAAMYRIMSIKVE